MVLNSVVIQSESCVNQSDSCELYAKMKEKYTKTNLCSLTINLKALNISNDMSASDLRRRQTEAEKNVNRLRNCMPEKLETFCKMHLSFLLELDGSKLEEMFLEPTFTDNNNNRKKATTPFSKKKASTPEVFPSVTKEKVRQIYQLINFLHRSDNIKAEGLFRKTGNVTRQRLLKEWIRQGAELHLDDGTFSPHDIATVLKQFLAELPEPLLTQKHFDAYCQIVDMANRGYTDKDRSKSRVKQLKALQLMILLLPRENAILLECLLDLLHSAASVTENKMSASSLGVVFGPSLLCPRKLTPEEMHEASPIISKAVATMIENAPSLFTIPRELGDDVANFWREMEDPNIAAFDETVEKENLNDQANIQKTKYGSSSAVNTVLTFAERKTSEEIESSQDTQVALAQLYAHVQSMPESAKKKKLLKQFNRASGITPSSSQRKKHTRSRTFGESLKKHFPMLQKHKHRENETDSCSTQLTWSITKPINIDNTPDNGNIFTKTPNNKLTTFTNVSPAVHVVDLGASPCNVKVRAVKRLSDENINAEVKAAKIPFVLPSTENEIHYIKKTGPASKKVYPCTPDRRTVSMVSPITNSVTKLPESSKRAVMTPRSRHPVLLLQSPNDSYLESVL